MMTSLPYAWGGPVGQAVLKDSPEDFRVDEVLPEAPSGEGEHLWLTVEKTGQNTAWVARQLSRWANLPVRAVSYAGLKDRHAVTTQTFSLHLPGRDDPDQPLVIEGVRVLSQARHPRKLKTGQLVGNRFTIRLRQFDGDDQALAYRWRHLVEQGVPNYFGSQRFGAGGANLERARQWFRGEAKLPRGQQSIHLSAVRSYLFNYLLARRVSEATWNRLLPGDFAQFREGQGGFLCEQPEPKDLERLETGQLSPTASLPGDLIGAATAIDDWESEVLSDEQEWLEGLRARRMQQGRRKTRVYPENGELIWEDGDPVFQFFLPAGSYATMALREAVTLVEERQP